MNRLCMRCGAKIEENGIPNRIKFVGKEGRRRWIVRHFRQFFALIVRGFPKAEIEGYVQLCDDCWNWYQIVFSRWMRLSREQFLLRIGYYS